MPKQKRRQCIESIEGIEAGENGQKNENSSLPETAEDRRLEICGHWV